jgi:Yip1 domain
MIRYMLRIAGALGLDGETYDEVEADRGATLQALSVVLLASVATGIGFLRFGEPWGRVIALNATGALIGWVVWAMVIYGLGTYVFPPADRPSSVGELLRTTGFASAPAMLRALTGMPVVGPIAFVVGSLWMFVATVVGVQHALDYPSVWRALAVCATGWLVSFIFVAIIGIAFAPPVF